MPPADVMDGKWTLRSNALELSVASFAKALSIGLILILLPPPSAEMMRGIIMADVCGLKYPATGFLSLLISTVLCVLLPAEIFFFLLEVSGNFWKFLDISRTVQPGGLPLLTHRYR
ncbi:hypothetical protein F5X97DRAFT_193339 [Nemania serpens]|nr:hypothetical protein F5X97DRAFT_193339 [Nemania serpens]